MQRDIHDEAQGRWRGILSQYGLSQRNLSGRHGPCPICNEGKDRFRFDDKEGRGTWFCNSCGAGSGVDLVMKLKGLMFTEAAKEVRSLIGTAKAEPIKAGLSHDQKRQMRVNLWGASAPVVRGDPVDQYLAGRGIDRPVYEKTLRYNPLCRYSESQSFPAMIAAVQDSNGQGVSLHRTYLLDGEKAPVDSPRRLMPGELPSGACVRLSPVVETMGIAEGIETAFACWDLFGVPTWASINASLMAAWEPPHGVKKVVIYGDNDASYTGQTAAFQLAKNLHRKGLVAEVQIPENPGTDWADVQKMGVAA